MTTTLIIPAAGRGSRFGADVPKQYLALRGRPVLAWTLQAFAGEVDSAIIAVDKAWMPTAQAIVLGASFPVTLVLGGATRQASVLAALRAAADGIVLIHDAVRPLVPRHCIADCIAAIREHGSAVVAVPCAATVKRTADGRTVAATVPRDDLWLAQTPQGFRRDLGLTAFADPAAGTCSDDAQVLERSGHAPVLVLGDARNLKITTPDDLALAEALLAG
ncbi:2-C-methyl-D-erythritol 4-phosphate cytidylyltransferase [Planctomycetota bacterium]|nr:2-C-methyl-D-erythritol 4-phosphate cytidylyltransferase [Planctomycetota bacterium]